MKTELAPCPVCKKNTQQRRKESLQKDGSLLLEFLCTDKEPHKITWLRTVWNLKDKKWIKETL